MGGWVGTWVGGWWGGDWWVGGLMGWCIGVNCFPLLYIQTTTNGMSNGFFPLVSSSASNLLIRGLLLPQGWLGTRLRGWGQAKQVPPNLIRIAHVLVSCIHDSMARTSSPLKNSPGLWPDGMPDSQLTVKNHSTTAIGSNSIQSKIIRFRA